MVTLTNLADPHNELMDGELNVSAGTEGCRAMCGGAGVRANLLRSGRSLCVGGECGLDPRGAAAGQQRIAAME